MFVNNPCFLLNAGYFLKMSGDFNETCENRIFIPFFVSIGNPIAKQRGALVCEKRILGQNYFVSKNCDNRYKFLHGDYTR